MAFWSRKPDIAEVVEQAVARALNGLPTGAVASHSATEIIARSSQAGGFMSQLPSPLPRDPVQPAMGPGAALFPVPLDPLGPSGRPLPRRYQYQIATNLQPLPHRYVPFEMLKQVADPVRGCDLVRRCIEIRKDNVLAKKWDFVVKAEAVAAVQQKMGATSTKAAAMARDQFMPEIERLRTTFEYPDWYHGVAWAPWANQILEQLMVIDATTVYPQFTFGGRVSFEVIDGATIKPIIDHRGFAPVPPEVAYQQVLWGFPRGEFTAQEDPDHEFLADAILYRPRNPRADSPYGLSPVEISMPAAGLWMGYQAWLRTEYTDGTMPRLGVKTNTPMTPQEVRNYQSVYNDRMAGQLHERQRTQVYPEGFDPMVFPDIGEKFKVDYAEMLIKQIGSPFHVMPTQLGVIPHMGIGGRGQQEGEQDQSESMGDQPTDAWFESLINELATRYCAMSPEVGFVLNGSATEQDELATAQAQQIRISSALTTLNRIQGDNGEPPFDFPEADEPMVVTATGVVFLKGLMEKQNAPAPTPIVAAPGQQPPSNGNAPPTPDDKGAELKQFATFADRRKGKAWRDFEFRSVSPELGLALNEAGRSNDFGALALLTQAAGGAPSPKADAPLGGWAIMGRIALAYAGPLHVALAGGLDPKVIVEAWRKLRPDAITQTAPSQQDADAQAAEAMLEGMEIPAVAAARIVRALYRESYAAGVHSADGALADSPDFEAAADDVSKAAEQVDWPDWAPGDATAVSDLATEAPERSLQELLDEAGITIKGIRGTQLEQLGKALAASVQDGDSVATTEQKIQDLVNSPLQAHLVALTETARAMNRGALDTYQANDVPGKEWLTQLLPCAICEANKDAGVIPLTDAFPSGAICPPAHPRCRCVLLPAAPSKD